MALPCPENERLDLGAQRHVCTTDTAVL